MYTTSERIHAVVLTLVMCLLLVSTSAHAISSSLSKQLGQIVVKELQISKDGKAIVDQNGVVVARFAKDIKIKQTEGVKQKLQGCMCCTTECLVYDQNGRCIKTYNSCTWDFDCNCKK
jgi:hypothetical protein